MLPVRSILLLLHYNEMRFGLKEKQDEYEIKIKKMEKIKVEIEYVGHNFTAYSPQYDGCVATANSVDKLKKNYAEAIEFHFEGMAEDGEIIPSEYELEFVLSVQALLRYLNGITTLKTIHRVTGISKKVLSDYVSGSRKAREKQRAKIVAGLHKIGRELQALI
jgi:predicted RNase H-like HicB family nuclease